MKLCPANLGLSKQKAMRTELVEAGAEANDELMTKYCWKAKS